jgi:DNA-directed RNA polymerase subunit RPC12/RpoP
MILSSKAFSLPAEKNAAAVTVKCGACSKDFDYLAQTDVAMGAVKCPNCGAVVNQEGKLAAQTGETTETATITKVLEAIQKGEETIKAYGELLNKSNLSIADVLNRLDDLNKKFISIESELLALKSQSPDSGGTGGSSSPEPEPAKHYFTEMVETAKKIKNQFEKKKE